LHPLGSKGGAFVLKLGLVSKQKPQFRYKGIAVFDYLWYNKHKEIKRRLFDEKNQYFCKNYL